MAKLHEVYEEIMATVNDYAKSKNITVKWPNTFHDQKPDKKEDWLRLTLRGVSNGQDAFSSGDTTLFKDEGIVIIDIFSKLALGISQGALYADELRAFFHNRRNSCINFFRYEIKPIGVDGAFHHTKLTFSFSNRQEV